MSVNWFVVFVSNSTYNYVSVRFLLFVFSYCLLPLSWLLLYSFILHLHGFSVTWEAIIWLVLYLTALGTVQVLKYCMSMAIIYCEEYLLSNNFVLVVILSFQFVSVTYHIIRLVGRFHTILDFCKLLLCEYFSMKLFYFWCLAKALLESG
jgi:hypothetical protein